MKWDPKHRVWIEDEWLVGIFDKMWLAKSAVEEWGNGRPYDNGRELQITRYFGKRSSPFEYGTEVDSDAADIFEKVWVRYAEYLVQEKGERV